MNPLFLAKLIAIHPLNRGGRARAFGRFARWQLGSRLLRQPVALQFVNDTRLVTETGMVGATANYYFGLQEVDEMGFALHVLRPGDLFADIGANVGSYTVLASATGATIISVEPLPHTFERLMRNIRFNGIEAEAHCCGLSSETGELRFTIDRDAKNRVVGPSETGPTTSIPVTTLDTILAGRVPFLIKIDVEGHEPQLLAGGTRTFSDPNLQAVLMETSVNAPELLGTMQRHGFERYFYDALARRLYPVEASGRNTIFVRDPAMIQQRCKAAERYTLVNGSI